MIIRIAIVFAIAGLVFFLSRCSPEGGSCSKEMDRYFEKIRDNEASLTAFFSAMPKGGDLHNHYSGSIYAETFWDYLVCKNAWTDTVALTYELDDKKVVRGKYTKHDKKDLIYGQCKRISVLSKGMKALIQQRMFQEWSIKDYYDAYRASDKHFFDAFGKFPSDGSWRETNAGLRELKERAKSENVQYLEIMIGSIPFKMDTSGYGKYGDSLRYYNGQTDLKNLDRLLNVLLHKFEQAGSAKAVQMFTDSLKVAHHKIDDAEFTMRYLGSVKREAKPVDVFKGLAVAFKAAETDPLVVGVNIVSREDGEIAMKDYKLHMQMFNFLRKKYGRVKYSLHAGELTLGLVKPEDLTSHIYDAVYTAGAKRIGHGVDIAYEKDCFGLMKQMNRNKIAVEINLWSNEFILKVKDDRHPIMLYKDNNVPIVISTDDAGILRSNLTHQFVLLAKRYPEIKYADIRNFILNSVEYSFIKEKDVKDRVLASLKTKIQSFEEKTLAR